MELEKQPPQADIYSVLTWFELNKKKLVYALVAAVVLGVGALVVADSRRKAETQASAALRALPRDASSAQYLEVAAAYPGRAAGSHALYLGAVQLFAEGKFLDAQKRFQEFLGQGNDNPLAPEATFGIASALEAQGKSSEALAKYNELPSRFPNSSLVPKTKLAAAKLHEEQGQHEAAFRIYKELTSGNSFSSARMDAQQRYSALIKKHPELEGPVQTNRPSMNLTPTPGAPNTATPKPAAANPPAKP